MPARTSLTSGGCTDLEIPEFPPDENSTPVPRPAPVMKYVLGKLMDPSKASHGAF
jgi:hypothetical protein